VTILLETKNLNKTFGQICAVEDLSLTVGKGEIVALLGPNGAGKTTSIRMMTGFLAPSSGTASVCGEIVTDGSAAARRNIGYLPEGAPLYSDMTCKAFLKFIADVHGIKGIRHRDAIDKAVDALELSSVLSQRIGTLSKGFRRRVAFAGAILHEPAVLIMDEPTDGLDPNQKHEVRNLIRRMSDDRAILISTHILEEVETLCTRAAVITGGRLCADETPSALKARSRYCGAVTLVVPESESQAIINALNDIPQVASVEHSAESTMSRLTAVAKIPGTDISGVIGNVIDKGRWNIGQFSIEGGRLDDVFRQLTAPRGQS